MSEKKDFVWKWAPGERGWYQPGIDGEFGARMYFWNNYQGAVLRELQKEFEEGWKPITEVGPAAFLLNSYEVTGHDIGVVDVLMWFATLGLTFLLSLATGFHAYKVTRYEPVEFRVGLVR
jgi:hypothetical protein